MSINDYSQAVLKYIAELNDEEFYNFLLEAGLEKCPYVATTAITISIPAFQLNTYEGDSFYSSASFGEETRVFFKQKVA